MIKMILRRVRSRLPRSRAAARMVAFSTCASLEGATTGTTGEFTRTAFTTGEFMGTPLMMMGPWGPSGPLVTGGPLLRPEVLFRVFNLAVTCLLAAAKLLTFEKV